ncbi:32788_t:CDS:2, partial [Gigaspora margarita]
NIDPEAQAAHIIQNITISPNPLIADNTAEFTISLSTANYTFKNDILMEIDVMVNGITMDGLPNNYQITIALIDTVYSGEFSYNIAANCLEANVMIPTSVN